MSTQTFLISGSSQGIGLEFVRQILQQSTNNRVIAAARDPASAEGLQKLIKENAGRIETLKLDVSDRASVKAAAVEAESLSFAKDGIDVLLNNAGVLAGGWGGPLDGGFFEDIEANMSINLYGVVATTEAFLPLLRKGQGKKIWTTSTLLASLGGRLAGMAGAASYSISKTAVNMYALKLARALEPEGFTVINYHPGYVRTRMTAGQDGAEIDVDESVSKSLKTLSSKGPKESGGFYDYEGEVLPW